jgi:putative glutathione S-transferase
MHHIKHHYYGSHESINPTRIVSMGPVIDFDEPHGRDTMRSPIIDAAE